MAEQNRLINNRFLRSMQNSILIASDKISPAFHYHEYKKEFYDIGNEVKSSLPLQIAFYFNVWLLPFWIIVFLYNLDGKYFLLSDIYKFITVAIFVIITVLECARLYLGYYGNLAEKIPELASFWLISTLLQLPLELFLLLDNNTLPHLSDKIINSLALVCLVFEILCGTVTLKKLADHHAKRFFIAQLYEIEDKIN